MYDRFPSGLLVEQLVLKRMIEEVALPLPMECEFQIKSFVQATDECIKQTEYYIIHYCAFKYVLREYKHCVQTSFYRYQLFVSNIMYVHWTINPNNMQLQAIVCAQCGNYLVISTNSIPPSIVCRCQQTLL